MNRFENVCETCPLRTKVDLGRARETGSMGSDGMHAELYDGKKRVTVTLSYGEVEDSDTAWAIEHEVAESIDECDGPQTGLMRTKCAVGLASAWRWAEVLKEMKPNVTSAGDITPLLAPASRSDAMPYSKEAYWAVGDLSGVDINPYAHSSFQNLGIRKLTQSVRGTTAELPRGKAVMLDRAQVRLDGSADGERETVCRIRIAQGGPHYAYKLTDYPEAADPLAQGIFNYLYATREDIDISDALIRSINQHDAEERESLMRFVQSGKFLQGIEEGMRRRSEEEGLDQE